MNRVPKFDGDVMKWTREMRARGIEYHYEDSPEEIVKQVGGARLFSKNECRRLRSILDKWMPAQLELSFTVSLHDMRFSDNPWNDSPLPEFPLYLGDHRKWAGELWKAGFCFNTIDGYISGPAFTEYQWEFIEGIFFDWTPEQREWFDAYMSVAFNDAREHDGDGRCDPDSGPRGSSVQAH